MGSQISYKPKTFPNLSCSMCRRDCYITHVLCGCNFDPVCLHHEQELRSCPCKSNRVVYVREDILELEAISRKFEPECPPSFGTTLDFSNNNKAGISGFVAADDGKSSPAVSILTSSAHHEAPRHSEARAINTSMTKGTYTVDEISCSMEDACNGLGSCNASAMECSDNSDSESEIFRVKRRSTSSDKPTSYTKIPNLSEQQVLRRLKKVHPEVQRATKRPEESDTCSVRSVRMSQKCSNPASSDDEREDMVPISWRIKRRQLGTQLDDTSHAVKPQSCPPSSSSREEFAERTRDATAELRPKRVKIRLPSSASRQLEQQRSSGQRFSRDDKLSLGCPRTF